MDGIDAALVRIGGAVEEPRIRLLAFITVPYPWWLQKRLLAIARGESTTAAELSRLNTLLGELFGDAAVRVCQRGRVVPKWLFVVGSHGQTIFHFGGVQWLNPRESLEAPREAQVGSEVAARPKETPATSAKTVTFAFDATRLPEVKDSLKDTGIGIGDLAHVARPSTLQIAEAAVIAEVIGAPVVADFRTADMAAGGQGAPLVPMVDYLLLGDAREGRVALNIGGIANVTVIPARAKPEDVFGFDTGPGNMVLDALARQLSGGREGYDAGGRMAASGKVLESLLIEALSFPFFNGPPPKSAGREQFGAWFVEEYFLRHRGAGSSDLLRTATELTARTISDALERFVFPRAKVHRLIVSGGGAHNKFLMKRLGELLPQLKVELSDRYGLPVDAKEAIAFAVLADRTMHGLPGNLPSVTGARRAVVLGKLLRPW
jgi:1,6-anhydro-N-acetylmuramate kinase